MAKKIPLSALESCGTLRPLQTTPNAYHTPPNFTAFQIPTATDLLVENNKTVQVIVASSPKPVLYWDDNNGHKSSLNILMATNFPANSTVYLDDMALTYNSTGIIYAYVTSRALLTNKTTEIHLLTFPWNTTSFTFSLAPFTSLQDTRPTTTDPFVKCSNLFFLGHSIRRH